MRYLPLTDADRKAMLAKIGVTDIDALFADIPEDKRLAGLIDLPKAKGELEVERELGRLAARNVPAGSVPFFVGAGAYKHHVPATVDHLIQRSEFLTSYTPYQPEIAQGTLQYLFEFQTQVAMLTGMEVANASMYDGSTAAGRGRADGASRHPAAQGACWPATCTRTIARPSRPCRAWPVTRSSPCSRRRTGGRTWPRPDRRERLVRRGAEPGFLRPPARSDRRSPRRRMRPARC